MTSLTREYAAVSRRREDKATSNARPAAHHFVFSFVIEKPPGGAACSAGRLHWGVHMMSALRRGLFSVAVVVVVTGGTTQAQDLDQGKSGAKLFATGCASCHRSPRGLAKGRISWSLSYYLQQHYTSSPASAQALTAYLQSVDAPPVRSRPATAKSGVRSGTKPRSQAAHAGEPPLRPPAPVPRR